jgi:hypothetical protein
MVWDADHLPYFMVGVPEPNGVSHCEDPLCESITTVPYVGPIRNSGQPQAITADGHPLLAGYSSERTWVDDRWVAGQGLWFARCDDQACTNTLVDPDAYSAHLSEPSNWVSMAVGADGNPVISYYDGVSNRDLKVAHCTDPDCASATISTLDSDGDVGLYNSTVVGSDGNPIISYYDRTHHDLKTAHCHDPECSSATFNAVDTIGWVGEYTSMALGDDGLPVIAYHHVGYRDLRLARCHDLDCSTASITTIDAPGWVGQYASLALDGHGHAFIAYSDGGRSHSTSTPHHVKLAVVPPR